MRTTVSKEGLRVISRAAEVARHSRAASARSYESLLQSATIEKQLLAAMQQLDRDNTARTMTSEEAFLRSCYTYAASQLQASCMADLPWEWRKGGKRVPCPWPDLDWWSLIRDTMLDWDIMGSAYWIAWPEGPEWKPACLMAPVYDATNTRLVGFTERVGNERRPWPVELVIWFKAPNPSNPLLAGPTPAKISVADATVLAVLQELLVDYYVNGGIRVMTASTPEKVDGKQRTEMEQRWKQRVREFYEKGRRWLADIVILSHGLELKEAGDCLKDMEVDEMTIQVRNKTSVAYNQPESFFADSANYATAGEHHLRYFTLKLHPGSRALSGPFNATYGRFGLPERVEVNRRRLEGVQREELEKAASIQAVQSSVLEQHDKGWLSDEQAGEILTELWAWMDLGENIEKERIVVRRIPSAEPPRALLTMADHLSVLREVRSGWDYEAAVKAEALIYGLEESAVRSIIGAAPLPPREIEAPKPPELPGEEEEELPEVTGMSKGSSGEKAPPEKKVPPGETGGKGGAGEEAPPGEELRKAVFGDPLLAELKRFILKLHRKGPGVRFSSDIAPPHLLNLVRERAAVHGMGEAMRLLKAYDPEDVSKAFEKELEDLFGTYHDRVAKAVVTGDPAAVDEVLSSLSKEVEASFSAVTTKIGNETLTRFAIDNPDVFFDTSAASEEVTSWFRQYAYERSKYVNETTRSAVTEALETYVKGKETLESATEAVFKRMTLDDVKDMLGPTFTEARAQLIATTETTEAVIRANHEMTLSMRDEGIDVEEFWMTISDKDVCPEYCEPLSDVVADEDGYFEVPYGEMAGEKVRGAAHPGCRCTTGVRPRPKKKGTAEE